MDESGRGMKTRPLKLIGAILEIVLSIPIIGLIVVLSPVFSIVMILLHGATLIIASKEESTILGNVFGFIASLIILGAFMFNDFNLLAYFDGSIFIAILLTWPLHIVSAIYIFRGMSQDKKLIIQQVEQIKAQDNAPYSEGMQAEQIKSPQQTYVRHDHNIVKEKQLKQADISPINQKKERELTREKERFIKAIRFFVNQHENGMKLGLDTSFLTRKFNYTLLHYLLSKEGMSIFICTEIMDELARIKASGKSAGRAATDAIALIKKYETLHQITFVQRAEHSFMNNNDLSINRHDIVVGAYLNEQSKNKGTFLLMTDDTIINSRAKGAGLLVAEY